MYYISSLSDEWSSSVVQAAHSLTAASAEAQLIVTPPTTINKIYKFIQTHTCLCLSHRYALSQFSVLLHRHSFLRSKQLQTANPLHKYSLNSLQVRHNTHSGQLSTNLRMLTLQISLHQIRSCFELTIPRIDQYNIMRLIQNSKQFSRDRTSLNERIVHH